MSFEKHTSHGSGEVMEENKRAGRLWKGNLLGAYFFGDLAHTDGAANEVNNWD